MVVNDFTEIINVRFTPEQVQEIDKIIKRYKGLYPSRSLFVRAATLKLLREFQTKVEKRRGKKRLLQNIKYE